MSSKNALLTMSSIFENVKTDPQFKASTGLSKQQFEELATTFEKYYQPKEHTSPYSRPPVLTKPDEALYFILYYFKVNPTFQVLGLSFGISNKSAHEYKSYIMPFLKQTLAAHQALAHRVFEDQHDFDRAFEGVGDISVDGYELSIERNQDKKVQNDHYSGKKNGIP